MEVALGILAFIAVLGVLVVVHELGHFAVAKLSGVWVLEFGVGYPPRLFSFVRGGTRYSLNLLPLGGFVRLLGEEAPDWPESFASKSAWRRLAILGAGSGMNALLPVLLFMALFMAPQQVVVTDVAVLDVSPGSPAQEAGVLPGDVVRTANGQRIDNTRALQKEIHLRLGADMAWQVERRGRLVEVRIPEARVAPPPGEGAVGVRLSDSRLAVAGVTPGSGAARAGLREGDLLLRVGDSPVLNEGDPEAAASAALEAASGSPVEIGVLRRGALVELALPPETGGLDGLTVLARPTERRSQGPIEAVGSSVRQMWEVLVLFRNEISRWVGGAGNIELSGPVGIAQATTEITRAGISPLITWTALLSMNLAIINLLPIPALDGGRIALVLLELARGGRRLAPGKERMAHLIGFVALVAMIIAISVNDIQRLAAGGSILGE